jgi:hypothetical protein
MIATNGYRLCNYCRKPNSIRARGLCSNCYQKEDIRKEFASALEPVTKLGSGITRAGNRESSVPRGCECEPTTHPPGSIGKIMVMCDRASKGLPLFHPRDAIMDQERRPDEFALLVGF